MLYLSPKRLQTLFGICLILHVASAQPYTTWDEFNLTLDNGIVQRQLNFDSEDGSFSTISLVLIDGDTGYLSERSDEFSFNVNGKRVSGREESQ